MSVLLLCRRSRQKARRAAIYAIQYLAISNHFIRLRGRYGRHIEITNTTFTNTSKSRQEPVRAPLCCWIGKHPSTTKCRSNRRKTACMAMRYRMCELVIL